jgi:hypothetical protein
MKPRLIRVTKEHRLVGAGSFGRVYRINKTQVLKVFRYSEIEYLLREIAGSYQRDGLDIDEVVRVKFDDSCYEEKTIFWGCIKRYIPGTIDNATFNKYYVDILKKRNPRIRDDIRVDNVRIDHDSRPIIVDTGVYIRR